MVCKEVSRSFQSYQPKNGRGPKCRRFTGPVGLFSKGGQRKTTACAGPTKRHQQRRPLERITSIFWFCFSRPLHLAISIWQRGQGLRSRLPGEKLKTRPRATRGIPLVEWGGGSGQNLQKDLRDDAAVPVPLGLVFEWSVQRGPGPRRPRAGSPAAAPAAPLPLGLQLPARLGRRARSSSLQRPPPALQGARPAPRPPRAAPAPARAGCPARPARPSARGGAPSRPRRPRRGQGRRVASGGRRSPASLPPVRASQVLPQRRGARVPASGPRPTCSPHSRQVAQGPAAWPGRAGARWKYPQASEKGAPRRPAAMSGPLVSSMVTAGSFRSSFFRQRLHRGRQGLS